MGIVFAVRGTSLDARYSSGGKFGLAPSSGWTVTVDAGAINGSSLVADSTNTAKGVIWPGRYNTPNGRAISVLIRFKPGYSGTPSVSRPLIPYMAINGSRHGRFEISHLTTSGNLGVIIINQAGSTSINSNWGTWSPTATTWYDVVFTWDGNTTANAVKLYIDGVQQGAGLTAGAALSASWANTWWSEICLGGGINAFNFNGASIDEIVIWDSVIDPTSVTLDSGTGSLNGASRTSPVTVSSFDGSVYVDPGIANVKTGTGYTQAGVSLTGSYTGADRWSDPGVANVVASTNYLANASTLTGTYISPTTTAVQINTAYGPSSSYTGTYDGSDRWTDPGDNNVRFGTAYKANTTTSNKIGRVVLPTDSQVKIGITFETDASTTGTYTGADRWSDPGAANVLSGTSYLVNAATTTGSYSPPSSGTYTDPGITNVRLSTNYIYNSVTLTGQLNVPTSVSGTAGTCDTNTIKETIRYVLSEANTTTGSPIDLSTNLSTRVQSILKVNPEKIMPQASLFPAVTVFLESKKIEQKSIASNQVYGRRRADLVFKIVALNWNDRTQDYRIDPSDNDLEYLMENIELVLRSYASLNANCNWQFPTGITYHSGGYDETTHFRIGILDLQVSVYY